MNVSDIIKPHVAKNPDTAAILFEELRITYLELNRLINRLAGGLLKLDLKRGDVLSLFLPSLPELIIGYLATVRAGLTVNVVNAMLREQEVAYILKDCDGTPDCADVDCEAEAACSPAGAVPDGWWVPGTMLTVDKAGGGDITRQWDPSCRSWPRTRMWCVAPCA